MTNQDQGPRSKEQGEKVVLPPGLEPCALSLEPASYSIRPFQPEDLEATIQREKHIIDFFGTRELAASYQRGPAFTILFNGNPIGMAGVILIWQGLGEAWAMFCPGYRKHKIFIHRETLRHLRWIAVKHNLRRIQAMADAGDEMACRWLTSLGFKWEGNSPEYWSGRTFARFGRIFPGERHERREREEINQAHLVPALS